jgi:hypothetical protein
LLEPLRERWALARSHTPCGGLVRHSPVLLITAAGLLLFADHTPPFGPGAIALALGLQGWQSTATIKEKRA